MKAGYNGAAFARSAGIVQIAAGATVEIRREDTDALATLYADKDGTAWTQGNPFSADSEGRFRVYLDGLQQGYKVTVTQSSATYALRNVPIGNMAYRDDSEFPNLTDLELQAIAALTSAADKLPYFTGLGTAALTTLTAYIRTLLDDVDQPTARTTLGVGTGDTPGFAQVTVAADPTTSLQVATKQYVDNSAAGFDVKPSVKAATTANLTRSGTQTVDGIALVANDRCLVKNQTAPAENGIFLVQSGAWTRATDMDAWLEVPGAFTFVEQGSANADTGWVCTADQGGTLNTTSITWSQFAGVGAYQALDAELSALAGLTSAADQLPYFTGSGTAALTGFNSSGRALVGLTGATDTVPYFTAAGAASTATFNSSGRAVVALVGAADKVPYYTGAGAATTADFSSLGRAKVASTLDKQAIYIPSTAMKARSSSGAKAAAQSAGASNQPDVDYIPFDGATKTYAQFCIRMPKSWNEGTVTAAFAWRRASGTGAANVVWGIRAVAVSSGDTPAANFGTDATVTAAAQTTLANFAITAETGACTVAGTPAAEDLVFFEVFRDGAAAGDTLDAVDAWLTGVTLYVNIDAANDA